MCSKYCEYDDRAIGKVSAAVEVRRRRCLRVTPRLPLAPVYAYSGKGSQLTNCVCRVRRTARERNSPWPSPKV